MTNNLFFSTFFSFVYILLVFWIKLYRWNYQNANCKDKNQRTKWCNCIFYSRSWIFDDKEQLIDRLATLTTGGSKNPTVNVDPHRTGLYTRRKKPLYTGQEVYWRHPQTGQIRELNPNFKFGYVKRPYGYRYVEYIPSIHWMHLLNCRPAH